MLRSFFSRSSASMGNNHTKTHPCIGNAEVRAPEARGACVPANTENQLVSQPAVVVANQGSIRQPPYECSRGRNLRETPDLYVYCSYRNWDLAKRQIDLNRGLGYISTNRRFTVLHVAVENNAPVEIVQTLIDKGLDPNHPESLFDQTPLHVLMKVLDDWNTYEILELLISKGADVNAVAKYGRTPLYFAIKHRIPMRGLARLLRAGAKVGNDVTIFAREKSRRAVSLYLDHVAILVALCAARMRVYPCPPQQMNITALPLELLREVKRMLIG